MAGASSANARSQRQPFSALFLAAGLSSRFGYRVKCLQPVGRHGETLLELSVRQMMHYGVSDIILIVSKTTYDPIYQVVGDCFVGLTVRYCFQQTPERRKKPMGTVHALLAAKSPIDKPFVVLNGDTLYGESALSQVCTHAASSDNPCMPGYPLKDVLPKSGKVNRAVIKIEDGMLNEIVEQYNISMDDVKSGRYSGDELTSMNIFAFQPQILDFAQRKFDIWLKGHQNDKTSEYILSTMLNDLLPETGIATTVYNVKNAVPLELTNPEDFAYVRNNLSLVGL